MKPKLFELLSGETLDLTDLWAVSEVKINFLHRTARLVLKFRGIPEEKIISVAHGPIGCELSPEILKKLQDDGAENRRALINRWAQES
jgi:hypothetical protein